jgi:ferredoxin
MQKMSISYFSGTGNTDYVAHYLARRLVDLPVVIELHSIERRLEEARAGVADDAPQDLLAVGFPVYAGDAPDMVQDYLAYLPPGEGRGAFIFCTKGAIAGSAVNRNLARLQERGYVPLGGGSIGMPGSDGLAFIGKNSRMARSALEKDYDHLKEADRLAGQMAGVISALGDGASIEAFRQAVPQNSDGPGDRLAARLYRAGMDCLRTRFWADRHCESCGLCEQICPVGNVTLSRGLPVFSDHCMLCMRCIHTCPQEAIQIGRFTAGKFRWHGPTGLFKPLRLRPASGESEAGQAAGALGERGGQNNGA